jgi:hypothetical protein
MSNFPALDIAIGLSFIYLLLSLISTTVNEMIAGWLKTRARFLEKGISALLQDPSLKDKIYNHSLIKSLSEDTEKPLPSYIPAEKFAVAVMDVITGAGNSTIDMGALRNGVNQLASPALQQSLGSILDVAGNDADLAREKIEDWFNQGMDRVSGWYKRNAQRNLLILAFVITLSVNADTFHIVDVLWRDPTTRAALVEQAKNRISTQEPAAVPLVEYDDPENPTESKIVSTAISPTSALTEDEKQSLNQLTGWTIEWAQRDTNGSLWMWLFRAIKLHWLGWILTAIALSLGAPFWFDTLNRFMTIRNSGRAPDERRAKNAPAPAVQVQVPVKEAQ